MIIKYISVLAVMLVALAFVNMPSAHASSIFRVNRSTPVSISVFAPCLNKGQGDVINLSGKEHFLLIITADNNGGVHFISHINEQGVTGVSQTTGAKYHGTGSSTSIITGRLGSTFIIQGIFHLIGQGTSTNLLVHQSFHITVNPDGTVRAFINNFSIKCK
jgi:hypothetical protein